MPRRALSTLGEDVVRALRRDRLLANIERLPWSGCWVWMRSIDKHGYGHFKLDHSRTGMAHRVAWEVFNDAAIPPGLLVCHSCDNPSCVNPAHLFVGTMKDNIRDAVKKGRIRSQQPRFRESVLLEMAALRARKFPSRTEGRK